jgi:hypothetical protein
MRFVLLATGTAIGALTGFMLACSSLDYKLAAHQSAGGFEQAAVAVCTVDGFLIASHLDRAWKRRAEKQSATMRAFRDNFFATYTDVRAANDELAKRSGH